MIFLQKHDLSNYVWNLVETKKLSGNDNIIVVVLDFFSFADVFMMNIVYHSTCAYFSVLLMLSGGKCMTDLYNFI